MLIRGSKIFEGGQVFQTQFPTEMDQLTQPYDLYIMYHSSSSPFLLPIYSYLRYPLPFPFFPSSLAQILFHN